MNGRSYISQEAKTDPSSYSDCMGSKEVSLYFK